MQDGQATVVGMALEGENMRSVCQDPLNPRHLYACSVTDVYASEDGGESWAWLPAGGVDYREIWCMAVHPTRPNEIYLGTMPAAVYVSENGGTCPGCDGDYFCAHRPRTSRTKPRQR